STSGAKGLSFDLHIVNSHGERIYCYNSRLFDEVDIPASSGTYRIRLVLKPLLLASGHYVIDARTTLTNIAFDHYFPAAVAFEIPYFSPGNNGWDFKDSNRCGMVAMISLAPIVINKMNMEDLCVSAALLD